MHTASAIDLVQEPGRAAALLAPIRRKLLERMGEPQSAAGLAREMGLPRQKLNYHLRELEREGFVALVEERRKGNCIERLYRATARYFVIDPGVLGELGADPDKMQDRFSSAYLVAVAARTIRDLAELRGRAERAGKRLATFTLQAEVRFASAEERAAFAEELAAAVAQLVAKYHNEHAPGGRAFRFLIGGYPKIAKKREAEAEAEEAKQTAATQKHRRKIRTAIQEEEK